MHPKDKTQTVLIRIKSFSAGAARNALYAFLLFFAFAKSAAAVTIDTSIPGVKADTPSGIVSGFYAWALGISGLLALGALVWGGIKYTMSAGNPSGQSEGKEWVKAALFGLLLLLGAYLILYTINPALVNLDIPTLQSEHISAPSSSSACTDARGVTFTCPTGSTCVSGSCNAGGVVLCGGTTDGQCPSGEACVGSGGFPQTYSCKSTNPKSYTCGGDPPNSHYGTCPPVPTGRQLDCINVGGSTASTAHYMCQ